MTGEQQKRQPGEQETGREKKRKREGQAESASPGTGARISLPRDVQASSWREQRHLLPESIINKERNLS